MKGQATLRPMTSPKDTPLCPYRRHLWQALLLSAGVVALCELDWTVLQSLYGAGRFQGIIAGINRVVFMVSLPAEVIVRVVAPASGHHGTAGRLGALLLSNFLFYFIAVFGLLAWRRLRRQRSHAGTPQDGDTDTAPGTPSHAQEVQLQPRPEAPQVSRRVFLRQGVARTALAAAAGGAVAGLGGYATLFEPGRYEVTRRRFALRGLPPALEGLRVVQLSDIHHCQWISLPSIRRVVEITNALKPDLVLLTGDYVAGSPDYIAPVAEVLSHLRAKIAVLGVLGNHDWWEGVGKSRDAFKKVRIPLIDNTRFILSPERRLVASAREGLCIAGVGDAWEDEVAAEKALGNLPDEMPRLLLSHNPDAAEREELAGWRVDLMLAGHTHGGQVWVPGVGTPIVPSDYGSKYASGLVKGPHFPVYVTRGTGMTVLPVRFGVPPEISVFEFHAPHSTTSTTTPLPAS